MLSSWTTPCAVALTLALGQDALPPPGTVRLPDGVAAKAWASVAPDTEPATLPAELLGLGWDDPDAIGIWRDALEAARAQPSDPRARTALFALALDDGRAEDAWRHYGALGASPAWAARTLALALPGVPVDVPIEPGGLPRPLPDGTVLRPLVPPLAVDAAAGPWRKAILSGLRIGQASLVMTVSVEGDGVQIDFDHLAGGAADVTVILPEPEGYRIRVEYSDWFRQETVGEPLTLTIQPGDKTRSFFGRIAELRVGFPGSGPVPAQLETGGLLLELDPGDPERARFDALAQAFEALLGFEVTVVEGEAGIDGPWSCTVARIPGPADAAARSMRVRDLVSAVERHVLAPAGD